MRAILDANITRFFDFNSGIYFNYEYGKLVEILLDFERRSVNEIVKWPDFYKKLDLEIPMIANAIPIMGKPDHKYRIEFELLPSDDCICILKHA